MNGVIVKGVKVGRMGNVSVMLANTLANAMNALIFMNMLTHLFVKILLMSRIMIFIASTEKLTIQAQLKKNTIQMTANGLDVLLVDSTKTVIFRNGVRLMMKQVIWTKTDY